MIIGNFKSSNIRKSKSFNLKEKRPSTMYKALYATSAIDYR